MEEVGDCVAEADSDVEKENLEEGKLEGDVDQLCSAARATPAGSVDIVVVVHHFLVSIAVSVFVDVVVEFDKIKLNQNPNNNLMMRRAGRLVYYFLTNVKLNRLL